MPKWPLRGLDTLRKTWSGRVGELSAGPDWEYRFVPGEPPQAPNSLPETERWDLFLRSRADSPDEAQVTVHFRPCGMLFDEELPAVVGWIPKGEVWAEVWRGPDHSERLILAAHLIHEVARDAGGVVSLDWRDVDSLAPSQVYATETATYVSAAGFNKLLRADGFPSSMF